MVSHVRRPAVLLRLSAAGLLAVTVLAGTATGTVADIASACAKPPRQGFDRAGYMNCANAGLDHYEHDEEFTLEDLDSWVEACCKNFGGEWVHWDSGKFSCDDPADFDAPAQLPRFPDLGDVTATLTPAPSPPPAGPIAPLPPFEATLAPFG